MSHKPQPERREKSSLLVVSASFLLALAYLIMAGTTRPIDAFVKALKKPELMIWCVLVATQVSLWSYFLVPAYKRVMWLKEVKMPALGIIGFMTLGPCLIGMRLIAIEARPASEILLYGGFCSGVLALFYVSSHVVFSRSSWALIRAAEPVRDSSASAWIDAQGKRAKLAEAIGLGTTSIRAFQDGVAILAPLFGSGIALLLGKA